MNTQNFPNASSDSAGFGQIRFVLVETSRPGNIGAAARAMKTMGFSRLVLINPRVHRALADDEAIAFASGAQDILHSAQIVNTLDEALAGCRFAAAVSARLREFSPPVVTPRELAENLSTQIRGNTALVFGNERFGLPNEIVERCNVLINIPANPDYMSLNLAQAVQVLAYELRVAFTAKHRIEPAPIGFLGEPASVADIGGMFVHLEKALVEIGFLDPVAPKKLMPRLRRLLGRTQLEVEEVNILRGIAHQILKRKDEQGPSKN